MALELRMKSGSMAQEGNMRRAGGIPQRAANRTGSHFDSLVPQTSPCGFSAQCARRACENILCEFM